MKNVTLPVSVNSADNGSTPRDGGFLGLMRGKSTRGLSKKVDKGSGTPRATPAELLAARRGGVGQQRAELLEQGRLVELISKLNSTDKSERRQAFDEIVNYDPKIVKDCMDAIIKEHEEEGTGAVLLTRRMSRATIDGPKVVTGRSDVIQNQVPVLINTSRGTGYSQRIEGDTFSVTREEVDKLNKKIDALIEKENRPAVSREDIKRLQQEYESVGGIFSMWNGGEYTAGGAGVGQFLVSVILKIAAEVVKSRSGAGLVNGTGTGEEGKSFDVERLSWIEYGGLLLGGLIGLLFDYWASRESNQQWSDVKFLGHIVEWVQPNEEDVDEHLEQLGHLIKNGNTI